ncbi:MAG: adenosylcobalamin-dependent ribonucleoside-diphosphate reductase, partial [Planctomycetota bacterium]
MLTDAPSNNAIDCGGFTLSKNAIKVLESRYLKKDQNGQCTETPADLFRRVADTIAGVERRYGAGDEAARHWSERFYRLMTSGDFMPNSPTLMNAGREMGMLSACFVLPVRDSINEIFDSIKHTALIQKAGGGTGFAFDELRPTGDYIKSSGGTTSGPISFWRAFSEATNAIQQGAFRRGANMGMMYIHHPDILKFLHAKQDLSQFTNYNISVKVTDAWMGEFIEDPDSPHVVRNPRTGQAYLLPRELDIWKYDVRSLIPVDCVEPPPDAAGAYYTTPALCGAIPAEHAGKVYTKRDIWRIIVENAWKTGEPGVVFIDRINAKNPTPHVGRIEATNPCGEQPLLPYEACNLGSINLGKFVLDACTPEARVDWDRLRDVVHASTRFLDNVVDANNYPLPEIERMCRENRKIGLGVMGFADALFMLGVPYNSDEGVEWGEQFMRFINDEAHNCSEQLARERGCFPNWKGSHWQTRHNRLMRNACCTTVAPTGTISIIANCSGGIEPMFSLAFIRNVLRGQKHGDKPLVEVNETFRRVAAQRGILSDELLERIAREGTLAHIDEVPDDLKRVFV